MGEEMRVDGSVFLKQVIPGARGPSYRPLLKCELKMRTALGEGGVGSFWGVLGSF